jgi:ABC-type lipoprotein export system ATPase subunit
MSIVAKDISKVFGSPPTWALKNVDLTIEKGSFVSITGRSGSGKSTLLYILSSLDRPSSGNIIIDGITTSNLNSKDIHAFRNKNMGFVFQFHHLFPDCTALENVLLPARKIQAHEAKKDFALQLLAEFDIANKANRLPRELSGGEQQRVAIARSLIMNPQYLFADEPTGNLDSRNGLMVMQHFERINREKKTTIVFVTHDSTFASMAKRSINLVDGQLDSASQ